MTMRGLTKSTKRLTAVFVLCSLYLTFLPAALRPGAAADGPTVIVTEGVGGTNVTITYPEDTDNTTFPFVNASYEADSDDVHATDLFFEITAPDDGKFVLWDVNDLQGFIDTRSPAGGQWYVFDNGDNTFSMLYYRGGGDASGFSGAYTYNGNTVTEWGGQLAHSANGALRFHFTDKGPFRAVKGR